MRACSTAPRRLPSEISVILSRNSESNANSLNRNRFVFSTVYTVRCTFLINSFRFIFRSAAPLRAARSLFLFLSPSVKRLKKKELKRGEISRTNYFRSILEGIYIRWEIGKMLSPASNGTFEFSFRSHFGSRSFHFSAECREPTCSGKNTYPERCWPCCVDQAKGISNFPEWVVPVEAFWRNRYREDEGKR